jgi:hypothetical protein
VRAPLQKRHWRVHAIEKSRQLTVFAGERGDSAGAKFREFMQRDTARRRGGYLDGPPLFRVF